LNWYYFCFKSYQYNY